MQNSAKTFRYSYGQEHRPVGVRFIFCLLITTLFYLTASSNTAGAATYYIDPVNGNDTNPGTSAEPWRTIAKAEFSVVNGSTVYLRSGNYGEVTIDRMGLNRSSWDDGVTYMADLNANPVFDRLSISGNENKYLTFKNIDVTYPSNGPQIGRVVHIDGPSHIKIIDCNITGRWDQTGTYLTRFGIEIEADSGTTGVYDILIEGCDISQADTAVKLYHKIGGDIVLRNNHMHIIASSIIGLDSYDGNGLILIEGNHLHDRRKTPGAHGSGISVRDSNVTIRGNIIHDFGGSGSICFYADSVSPGGTGAFENMLIENNLIYDGQGTTNLKIWGLKSNVTIRNNTIIGWDYASGVSKYSNAMGIVDSLGHEVSGLSIYNNVFVGLVSLDDDLGAFIEDNNIFWALHRDGSSLSSPFGSSSVVIVHSGGFNPGYDENYFEGSENFFVGGALFDQYSYSRVYRGWPYNEDSSHKQNLNDAYRLAATSEAVGFADPTHAPATDILGVSRVFPPDAGCYEYISSDFNNTAPVLAAIGDKSVNENSSLSFPVSATDADSDPITYSAASLPTGATFTGQNFSWTPDYNQAGTYPVTFIASDGQAQDSETITITVRPFSAAAIFSLTATKNTVEMLFTDLDANEANNPDNYTVTTANGAIETTSVFVDSGHNRVTVYATGHENGVPCYLTVSNIADAAGNVMPTTTISYLYDESLVGFWHFDVNPGSTMGDSSGNGNAGTLNGAVWTKRNYGGALSFDGTDDYVDCGNGADLNLTGSLTIAAWIRPDSFGQNDWGRIVDKSGGSGSEGYSFFVNEPSNNLAYVVYGATVAESNPGVVTIGKWQHVAVVYDESSGIVTFYADGEQVGSSAYSTPPVDSVVDPLVIGIRGYDDQRAFDGEIDDVRIYKRALSGEDISELSMQLCPVGDKKIKSGSRQKFKVVTLDTDIPVGIESHTLPSEPDFSSNVFSWTPASTNAGTYQVIFQAQHGSLVDEEIISITVDGDLTIAKCRVKAGKTPKQDSIIIMGTYSGTLSDLAGASSINISIVSATDDYQVYNEAIDFSSDDVVNGTFQYKYKVAKDQAGAITSFVLNQNKKTILLKGKNIDLTGLSCPFTLVITIGGNVISGQAAEAVVNKSKPIPMRLMRSYADTLAVDKAKAKARTEASSDSFVLKGRIAVEEVDSVDLTSEDVVLTWGSQTFTIPSGSMTVKTGKSYKFSKVTVPEGGVASGKIDLDKCKFNVALKSASLDTTSGTVTFGISFASFDETTQVTLP